MPEPGTSAVTCFPEPGMVRGNGGGEARQLPGSKVPPEACHEGSRQGDGGECNGDVQQTPAAGARTHGESTSTPRPKHGDEEATERRGSLRSNPANASQLASSALGSSGKGAQGGEVSLGIRAMSSFSEAVAGLVRDRGANAGGSGTPVGTLAEWVKHGSGDDSEEGTSASR